MVQIVLVHPQIPPNTGSIARTCAATQTELHLVEPLGFELSDRYLKRAGLDYWPFVQLHTHTSWEQFVLYSQSHPGRWLGFSTRGHTSYLQQTFEPQDWLLFGSESSGLPPEILAACTATVRIPIVQSHVRSLNLSVSVAIGLFEAQRQLGEIC